MYYEVFWRTFRDSKQLLIYYAAGVALLAAMEMAIYPSIHGIEGLQQLFDQYPKELLAAFGIPSGGSFLTAAGFLQGELFGFMMPAVFLFYAVGMGGNLIAGEEQRRRLELLPGAAGFPYQDPSSAWFGVGPWSCDPCLNTLSFLVAVLPGVWCTAKYGGVVGPECYYRPFGFGLRIPSLVAWRGFW